MGLQNHHRFITRPTFVVCFFALVSTAWSENPTSDDTLPADTVEDTMTPATCPYPGIVGGPVKANCEFELREISRAATAETLGTSSYPVLIPGGKVTTAFQCKIRCSITETPVYSATAKLPNRIDGDLCEADSEPMNNPTASCGEPPSQGSKSFSSDLIIGGECENMTDVRLEEACLNGFSTHLTFLNSLVVEKHISFCCVNPGKCIAAVFGSAEGRRSSRDRSDCQVAENGCTAPFTAPVVHNHMNGGPFGSAANFGPGCSCSCTAKEPWLFGPYGPV